MIDTLDITGLVLAGGRGSRMGKGGQGAANLSQTCRWRYTR